MKLRDHPSLVLSRPRATAEPQGEIPLYQPLLEAEEKQASLDALNDGWLGMGTFVAHFEREVEARLGVDDGHVIALSTGHAAVHLALILAGVGPGDEVITSAFNAVADFQAILAVGAKPVFCDVLEGTLCIDPAKAGALIGSRTRALIAMDFGCHLCAHDELAEIGARSGVRVVHDAAHSFGSRYRGKPVASYGDFVTFSFDPIKTVTCIDGGALVVRTEGELAAAHEMRLIGMAKPNASVIGQKRTEEYDVARLGFRYHMANLHAAIGNAQLAKFERIAATRRALLRRYNEAFASLDGVEVPAADADNVVAMLYYIRIDAALRAPFKDHMRRLGIEIGSSWIPGHKFSAFSQCRRGSLGVIERAVQRIVLLPFHSDMPEERQERVIAGVRSFFAT